MPSDDELIFDDDLLDQDLGNLLGSNGINQKSNSDLNNVPNGSPKEIPTHHVIDYENLSTYIYPTNLEIRSYQMNIVQKALYHNTLVALPTGLGKTFIASTVMINFHRWFPESKIIFMAPTRPLVAQQIRACCGITGIPSTVATVLLDKTRKNRSATWNEKNIFFTTPQVVENDLKSGFLNPKMVVLLIIDEAHRAKGNYAYNNVVKFLDRFNKSYRILALTATPASDIEGVQEIVTNLSISKVEVRTEKSIDIMQYVKRRRIQRFSLDRSSEIEGLIELLCYAVMPTLKIANERKIYDVTDPSKINAFQIMEASQRIIKNPSIPEGLKWQNFFILQILNTVGQGLRRLNIYGVRLFYNYFYDKHKEFTTKFNNKKSTNKIAARFYFDDNTTSLLQKCEEYISKKDYIGHPKLCRLLDLLKDFFQRHSIDKSRVIIFTEFRESALEIVQALEEANDQFKPHIFIGQSKEKENLTKKAF